MMQEPKIIKNRLGLLKLAETLGRVSQVCKVMGSSRDSFYRFKELHENGGAAALGSDVPLPVANAPRRSRGTAQCGR